MPKELFEIKGFHKGIDSSTSSEDIAQDSASHSINVDCTARDGALVGIPTDETLTTTNLPTTVNLDSVARIDKSVIAFYDNGDVYKADEDILAFENEGSLGVNVTPTTFEPHNRELHVGTGSNSPKWVGYRKDSVTDKYDFHVSNAELEKPGGDNFNSPFTKVIKHSNTYSFGFIRGSKSIYRITNSNGTIDKNNVDLSFNVQDMCINISNTTTDRLIVLEKGTDLITSSVGKIKLIDISNGNWGQQLEVSNSERDVKYATNQSPDYKEGNYDIIENMEATEILETGSSSNGYVLWIQITHKELNYNAVDHGIKPRISTTSGKNPYLFASSYVHSGTDDIELLDQSLPLHYVDDRSTNANIYFETDHEIINYDIADHDHKSWKISYTAKFGSSTRSDEVTIPLSNYIHPPTTGSNYYTLNLDFTLSKEWKNNSGGDILGWYANGGSRKIRIKSIKNSLVATDSANNKVGYLLLVEGFNSNQDNIADDAYVVKSAKVEFNLTYDSNNGPKITHPANYSISNHDHHSVETQRIEGVSLFEAQFISTGNGSTLITDNTSSEAFTLTGDLSTPPSNDIQTYTPDTSWIRSIGTSKMINGELTGGFNESTNRLSMLSIYTTYYTFIAHNSNVSSKVELFHIPITFNDDSTLLPMDTFDYNTGDISNENNRVLSPIVVERSYSSSTSSILVFDTLGDLKVLSQDIDHSNADKISSTTVLLSNASSSINLSGNLESSETSPNFPNATNSTDTGVRFYKVSLTYDGYQESPLSIGRWDTSSIANTTNAGTTGHEHINVQVSLEVGKFNINRATHVNIYRADESNFPYRLVKQLKFNRDFVLNTNATHYVATHVDTKTQGATYEAMTGIPESLDRTIVNYTVSTQINSKNIVGGCFDVTGEDDFSRYLFMSKENRFDTFDWTKDLCIIPEEPIALSNYKGRIYAFSKNTMYRINPNGFYIEDTFEGIGCINKDCVTTTDYGMFWADHRNIYIFTGQGVNPIGIPILKGGSNFNAEWSSYWHKMNKLYPDYKYKTIFDPARLSFMILGTTVYQTPNSDPATYNQKGIAWSYHILKKRWDLIEYPTNQRLTTVEMQDYADVVQFQDNTIVFFRSDSNKNPIVEKYLQGSSKRKWEWISKDITMGLDSQDKFLYKIKATYENTKPKVYYWVNTGRSSSEDATLTEIAETAETFNNTDNTGLFNAKVSTRRARSIQLELHSDTDTEVKSCGVVYRRRSIR